MHKKYNFNFLFLIASIFVLSSCNSDTDEPRMYEEYITYYGLNFEVNVKTKYFDSKIHYIVRIEDISDNYLSETDYFEKLQKGSLGLELLDKDGFKLDEIEVKISNFTNEVKGEKVSAMIYNNSEIFNKNKYDNTSVISIYTNNMQ